MAILLGQIGWDTDADHFFPGEKTNSGLTLVRCQLFAGRDTTQQHTPDRAQGRKLTCQLSDGVFRVPKKNTRCYIAIPDGMDNVAGAGVIIATVSSGPEVNRNINPGDLVLSAPGGGQAQITIKQNGTINLYTTHNNLPVSEGGIACQFEITAGTENKKCGIAYDSPIGTWTHTDFGFKITDKASGAKIGMGSMNLPGLPSAVTAALSSYFIVQAAQQKLHGSNIVLGSGPSYGYALHAPSSKLEASSAGPLTLTAPSSVASSVRITKAS